MASIASGPTSLQHHGAANAGRPATPTFDPEATLSGAEQALSASASVASPSSRSSSHHSHDASSISSKSAASGLSATAPCFLPGSPSIPVPSHSDLFAVCAIPGKGIGLVASQPLERGTRIICEQPLLKISRNELPLVWQQYQSLSQEQKAAYDKLHRYKPSGLDVKLASLQMLDRTDGPVNDADHEKIVDEHIRVVSIFSCNNYLIAGGYHAVFPQSSRLNHSCIPNVYHCYNPTLEMETVHAIRDIDAGEELVTNYIGETCHYKTRIQRWEILRENYGFTCQCVACTDRSGTSDRRHEGLGYILWGLEQHEEGAEKDGNIYIPADAHQALSQAEDALRVLLAQELFGIELMKCYRLASRLALNVKNYARAMELAHSESIVERNIMGEELDDRKNAGAASEVWIAQLYTMGMVASQQWAADNDKVAFRSKKSASGGKKGEKKKLQKKQKREQELADATRKESRDVGPNTASR